MEYLIERLDSYAQHACCHPVLGGRRGRVESSFPMFHSRTADKEDCDARFSWESNHSELVRLSKRLYKDQQSWNRPQQHGPI